MNEVNTFFGLDLLSSRAMLDAPAVIYGIANSCASAMPGADNGAYFLRNLSKAYCWQAKETRIVDISQPFTDIYGAFDGGNITGYDQCELSKNIAMAIEKLSNSTVPILVGGDHAITYPALDAVKKRVKGPLKLIVFDHHLDVQYWSNYRDPLYNTNVMSYAHDLLGSGNIVHIGVDPLQALPAGTEFDFICNLKDMGHQIPYNSPAISNHIEIQEIVGYSGSIYISIDVDVLHEKEMRTTGYPSNQGISLNNLLSLIDLLSKTNNIVGCDIVEFCADKLDRSSITLADAGRATRILLNLLFAISRQSSSTSEPKQTNKQT